MTYELNATESRASMSGLSSTEQDLLARIPDFEQRTVLARELYRGRDLPQRDNLAVAENVLIYQMLHNDVFKKVTEWPESVLRYVTSYGTNGLRTTIAERLTQSFKPKEPIHCDNVFGTAGVASALECIALGLQTPLSNGGDVPVPRGSRVLLPSPFWQGFHWSFEQIPGLHCVPVPLTHAGQDKFELTLDDLDSAYATCPEPKPKLLVLTNPHNPLGMNYDKKLLEDIYGWALKKRDMHIISDEIYCHSQLTTATSPFVSALALDATQTAPPERVHVVWGFAKDFGLSGFRAGFLVSKSPHVRNAMLGSNDLHKSRAPLSWFTPFDSLKHMVIQTLLNADDCTFWDKAMSTYSKRLTSSYTAVKKILDGYKIPYTTKETANSAQFFWLDLRKFLKKFSVTEDGLYCKIQQEANVEILPGTTMFCHWPGYFRLCFSAYGKKQVTDAVERMCEVMNGKKS